MPGCARCVRLSARHDNPGKFVLTNQQTLDFGVERATFAARYDQSARLHEPRIWLETSVVIWTNQARAATNTLSYPLTRTAR
jgi:hypothetical protein